METYTITAMDPSFPFFALNGAFCGWPGLDPSFPGLKTFP